MPEYNALVRDVMATVLVLVERNETLARADELMREHRLRHILVVDDDGALQGVLSQRDLFHGGLLKALGYGTHARERALESVRAKDAMTSEPITVTPGTPLRVAARLMVECKIGCLPVLDGARLLGILTESDFARIVAGMEHAPAAESVGVPGA